MLLFIFEIIMEKHLHIISFNIPYPADYGGVIDVFYRLKALCEAGIKVHLHCFTYGRDKSDVLNEFCESVNYYPRSLSFAKQFTRLPFIVKTRNHKTLLANLLGDKYPILFEGLHSCYFLDHPKLATRNKIVRCHNIEHHYYSGLAHKTKNVLEGFYFSIEARKLKQFERRLSHANFIAAISKTDESYFQNKYGKTFLMPPCHPSEKVTINEGRGAYLLYHGDLSTRENTEAALFILNEIAPFIDFPFMFSGKNPAKEIVEKAKELDNVEIIANPTHEEMQQLIANAHINLLPTFQSTGFKLKLLNALFNGRFCVGTPELVEGTGLHACCEIVATPNDFRKVVSDLLMQDFTNTIINQRKVWLDNYTNKVVASNLLALL